jgi:hypothetical protein
MDIRAVSGSVVAVSAPLRGSGEATEPTGSQLRFVTGPEIVPAYIAKMLTGIETESLTRAQAIAEANRRAEVAYVNQALKQSMSGLIRR